MGSNLRIEGKVWKPDLEITIKNQGGAKEEKEQRW